MKYLSWGVIFLWAACLCSFGLLVNKILRGNLPDQGNYDHMVHVKTARTVNFITHRPIEAHGARL